jgi:hypothetical protein
MLVSPPASSGYDRYLLQKTIEYVNEKGRNTEAYTLLERHLDQIPISTSDLQDIVAPLYPTFVERTWRALALKIFLTTDLKRRLSRMRSCMNCCNSHNALAQGILEETLYYGCTGHFRPSFPMTVTLHRKLAVTVSLCGQRLRRSEEIAPMLKPGIDTKGVIGRPEVILMGALKRGSVR